MRNLKLHEKERKPAIRFCWLVGFVACSLIMAAKRNRAIKESLQSAVKSYGCVILKDLLLNMFVKSTYCQRE